MNENPIYYGDRAEFEDILKLGSAIDKIKGLRALCNDLQYSGLGYRKTLFAEYYNVSDKMIDDLLKCPADQRKTLCWEQEVNPYIFHTLFDYNAYQPCYEVYRHLDAIIDFQNISVLDYGCLVSDYGFFFGMLGSKISICDFKEYVDFASFRLSRHNIAHKVHYAPTPYSIVTEDIDMAIFGEVLEHLDDPLELLEACVENSVSLIYTTCYPFGDDAYFNLTGHSKEAQRQAPDSLALLRRNFHEIKFDKFRRLWILK